jgi:hypothetical protein
LKERSIAWEEAFRGPQYAADVVRAALEAAGVECLTIGDDTAYGPVMESRVLVPATQVKKARKIVAERS